MAEIKKYVRKASDESITEGVIAGALKTLTTGGIIENIERGKYRLICSTKEESCENSDNISVHRQILDLTKKYWEEAIRVINTIDISEGNKEVIMEGMVLRKK